MLLFFLFKYNVQKSQTSPIKAPALKKKKRLIGWKLIYIIAQNKIMTASCRNLFGGASSNTNIAFRNDSNLLSVT